MGDYLRMPADYKKVSSHGSVNIPVQVRRELGIQPRDVMELEVDGGEIVLRPHVLRCIYCGTQDGVRKLNGRGICQECARKAYEGFLKETGGDRNG